MRRLEYDSHHRPETDRSFNQITTLLNSRLSSQDDIFNVIHDALNNEIPGFPYQFSSLETLDR